MSLPRKDLFELPQGMIYLDGNSLGPLPKSVPSRLASVATKEWAQDLIKGWNARGWMEQPSRVGDRIASMLGAPSGSIVMGDTLSIKVFQAMSAALSMRPDRKVILSDTGNFPTDIYMAEGLARLKAQGHVLKTVAPEDVEAAIDETVAVLMLTEVDYRTGRKHDMMHLTEVAHREGAVTIWDLAHSAGALPVALDASTTEFAIGCTYKYLNGGPGAPAFIYVRPDISENVDPALAGWLGHESPFAFELGYRPGAGIERMRVGTPPVLQMAALEAALDVWDGVSIEDVRTASIHLSEVFIAEVEARCPELTLVSPRDASHRGSQVSFAFEHGYAAMQALIDRNVIGDFRAPNVMRFGLTPLYIDETDVRAAVDVLADVIGNRLWDRPEYLAKKKVT